MLFLSFLLLLVTNLSALTFALDYPFTPDGKFKVKGQVDREPSPNTVMKNAAHNTYFHPGAKMTMQGRPEADVAIARAKALNASRTTQDEATHVEAAKRDPSAGVYLCNNAGYGGGCWYQISTGGACHDVSSPYGEHSSFGPDGNVQCVIFNEPGCNDRNAIYDKYTWPGTGNLNWPGQVAGFGNVVPRSFRCKWCYGCFYGNAPHWINSFWDE